MALRIDIITLFPEMLAGWAQTSILKRAQERGVEIHLVNPRDFTTDRHKTCDDRPFGGGSGMVMKPEPISRAVEKIKTNRSRTILMSPQGEKLTQAKAVEMAGAEHLIFICGHYEGIDERVRLLWVDEEISIGDYILTNGALAAAVVADALIRWVPGVLGNPESAAQESFSKGMLEYPQYTRPRVFRGMTVPEILLSGNHEAIEKWRHEAALERTKKRRPDLVY